MSQPSIIFCGGSFTPLSVYQPILDAVSKEGHEIQGIPLLTVSSSSGKGDDGPAPSMYEDAEVIAQEASRLADQGKDVILIGHSYSGVPITQSTKDLSKVERRAQGKSGGIAQLAYMTCLVPALGQSALDVLSVLPADKQPPTTIDVCLLQTFENRINLISNTNVGKWLGDDGESRGKRAAHHAR